MKHPKVLYVTIEDDGTGDDYPVASTELDKADDGKVGVYMLDEIIDKREVVEIRRPNTKKWFQPA